MSKIGGTDPSFRPHGTINRLFDRLPDSVALKVHFAVARQDHKLSYTPTSIFLHHRSILPFKLQCASAIGPHYSARLFNCVSLL